MKRITLICFLQDFVILTSLYISISYFINHHYLQIFSLSYWKRLRFNFSSLVYSLLRTAMILETQNLEISGLRMRYKHKTKRQARMKRRQKKITFLLASHQSTFVPGKHLTVRIDHKWVKKIYVESYVVVNLDNKFTYTF